MSGPGTSWQQPAGQPTWPPAGQAATAVAPPVAWNAAAPAPVAPRPPADVAGVLRLVAGGLLAVAGALTAVAPFLSLFSLDIDGNQALDVDGWGSDSPGEQTPVRWGIPLLLTAGALLLAAALLVTSRRVARLRTATAAVGALAAAAVVTVGWMLEPFVGAFVDSWESDAFTDTDYDPSTGSGTVLVLVATWIGLAAVVPLLLAPVFDARGRAAGGAR